MNFHPPAPTPHRRPLNAVEFVWTMARNPLAIWSEARLPRAGDRQPMAGQPDHHRQRPGGHPPCDGRQRQELCDAAAAAARAAADLAGWAADRRGRAVEARAAVTGAGVCAAQYDGLATAMLARSELFAEGLGEARGQRDRHRDADDAADLRHSAGDIVHRRHCRRPRGVRGGDGEPAEDDGTRRSDGCAGCAGLHAARHAAAGAEVAGAISAR